MDKTTRQPERRQDVSKMSLFDLFFDGEDISEPDEEQRYFDEMQAEEERMFFEELIDCFYVPVFVSYNAVPYPKTPKWAFDQCGHYLGDALCGFAYTKDTNERVYLVNSDYELTHDCLEEFATVAEGILGLAQEIAAEVPGVTLINLRGTDERVREYLYKQCEEDGYFQQMLEYYCGTIKDRCDNYQDYYGMQEGELTSYFGLVLTDAPFDDSSYVYEPEKVID